jgi:glyoxylase-like metal-dependent hydrolase (beta-lactamase superfamily II)
MNADAQSLVERIGVPVYTPLPDTAEDLMRMYGITAEQAGDGSPDLTWLLRENKGEAHPYSAGDRLPVGIEAFPGQKRNDAVLWVESHRAVIAGDTLADFGEGPPDQPPLAYPRRDARAGRRGVAPVARAAGGAPARDARRPIRPSRPRARALLTDAPRSRSASRSGWEPR